MLQTRAASFLLVTLLVFAPLNTGCTTAKVSGRGAKPITLNGLDNSDPMNSLQVSEFRIFDYTGAVDVSEVIGRRLSSSEADAMTNTTVEVGANVGTFLANLVTLGLANAQIIRVRGDLVDVGFETGVVVPPYREPVKLREISPSSVSASERSSP